MNKQEAEIRVLRSTIGHLELLRSRGECEVAAVALALEVEFKGRLGAAESPVAVQRPAKRTAGRRMTGLGRACATA